MTSEFKQLDSTAIIIFTQRLCINAPTKARIFSTFVSYSMPTSRNQKRRDGTHYDIDICVFVFLHVSSSVHLLI